MPTVSVKLDEHSRYSIEFEDEYSPADFIAEIEKQIKIVNEIVSGHARVSRPVQSVGAPAGPPAAPAQGDQPAGASAVPAQGDRPAGTGQAMLTGPGEHPSPDLSASAEITLQDKSAKGRKGLYLTVAIPVLLACGAALFFLVPQLRSPADFAPAIKQPIPITERTAAVPDAAAPAASSGSAAAAGPGTGAGSFVGAAPSPSPASGPGSAVSSGAAVRPKVGVFPKRKLAHHGVRETAAGPASTSGLPPLNRIVIKARELTWISVAEDENPAYESMLKPGDTLEREAGAFFLRIGNAYGVDITLNNRRFSLDGKEARGKIVRRKGMVVTVKLP